MKMNQLYRNMACLIVMSILTASCGTSSGSDVTTSGENTTASSVDTTVMSTSEYQSPGKDYKGETFTILDYRTESYSWQAQSYSDITCPEENGEPINDALYKRNRSVEEELNIKLETINGTATSRKTADDLKKYILAGDDLIDAAFVFTGEVQGLIGDTEFLTSFDELTTMNPSASWWNQDVVKNFTLNDNLKVITGDVSYYTTISPFLVFFNKNMVETYKCGDLYELVRNGKWTIDEYIRLSKSVAHDVNGDTKMNESDRFGSTMQNALLAYMMRSCGVRFSEKNADGGVDIVLNNERTVSVFEKLMGFVKDTDTVALDSALMVGYNNVYFECMMPMFREDQILFYYSQVLTAFELRSMDTDFGLLPTPKYDDKQEDYITAVSNSWSTMLCVPKTNTKLEMTGYVLDALGYYSQQTVTQAVIDTTIINKGLRDEDSAEMFDIVLDNIEFDVAEVYNWGKIYSFLTTMATNGDTNFASNYASIEKNVLAELEKAFK